MSDSPVIHATSIEVDPPRERPAKVKHIAALAGDLTGEIRRQTCYLLLGLGRLASVDGAKQLVQLTADYETACEEADKRPPHK